MKKIISKNNNMSVFLDEDRCSIFEPGQVPYSYAFVSANADKETAVQGFKLGDTHVGPSKRVRQWQQVPLYHDAKLKWYKPNLFYIDDNIPVMFRDYNVHKELENLYGMKRMKNVSPVAGLSDEHFTYSYDNDDQLIEACDTAYYNVIKKFADPSCPYNYITMVNKKLLPRSYERVLDYPPRQLQQDTINHMLKYFMNNQDGQYLYSAPTRSGKTFTNLLFVKQLTDKLELDKSITLIVSAKADVLDEWKQGCESHVSFEKFIFLTKEHFANEPEIVQQSLAKNKHVIVFFTLQDLYGSNRGEGVKEAHKFLETCPIDLILSDEAHYAGFTEHGKLNKIIKEQGLEEDFELLTGLDSTDKKINKKAVKQLGTIKPRLGTVFITATPYNILFSDYYSFSDNNMTIITQQDIQKDAAKWIVENVDNGDKQPWQSPYFGIPKKYHFVIPTSVPPEDVFKLTKEGKFVHETYLSEFASDMFGVTNYGHAPNIFTDEVYKEARLGNNMILTVGQRSAADHLYEILHDVLSAELLEKYEIITISSKKGLSLSNKTIEEIKQYIDDCDKNVIVITCDRALTGVTMKKIDTIVFMRNMKSAQQFIQAAGRSASPWVVDMEDEDGNIIKHCMKENSAVISFDPYQVVDVIRAEIAYEAEHSKANGAEYEELMGNYLESNPIYMLDEDLVRLHEMNSLDIMSIARDYNSDKALGDLIPDSGFRIDPKNTEVLSILDQTTALSNDKNIKSMQLFEESINNLGFCYVKDCDEKALEGSKYCAQHLVAVNNPLEYVNNIIALSDDEKAVETAKKKRKELLEALREYKKKLRNIANLCLIYAVLNRDETIKSMNQLIDSINDPKNDELVNLLGINKDNLGFLHRSGTFNIQVDFALSEIEWRFKQPYDRAFDQYNIIFNTVNRISASEVVTPDSVVVLMLDKIDLSDGLKNGIIDNGCKSGVFLVITYERLLELGYKPEDIRDKLYCIPTSSLTYAIIRDIYQQYDWNTDNILFVEGVSCLEMNEYLADFVSGGSKWKDNIEVKSLFESVIPEAFGLVDDSEIDYNDVNAVVNGDEHGGASSDSNIVKDKSRPVFDYCVSNPPYQQEVGKKKKNTGNRTSIDIFPLFHKYAAYYSYSIVMIYPATWQKSLQTGHGKWLINNGLKNAQNFPVQDVFGNSVKKGIIVSTVLTKRGYKGDIINNDVILKRSSKVWVNDIASKNILDRTQKWKSDFLSGATYTTRLSNICDSGLNFKKDPKNMTVPIKVYIKQKPGKQADSGIFYIEEKDIINEISSKTEHFNKDKYNVMIQSAVFGRQSIFDSMIKGRGSIQARVFEPNYIAGLTLASLRSFDTKEEASHFAMYMNSKIVSSLLYFDYSRKTFASFVPDLGDYTTNNPDIDWSQPLDPQLYQLFNLTDEEINIINNSE